MLNSFYRHCGVLQIPEKICKNFSCRPTVGYMNKHVLCKDLLNLIIEIIESENSKGLKCKSRFFGVLIIKHHGEKKRNLPSKKAIKREIYEIAMRNFLNFRAKKAGPSS